MVEKDNFIDGNGPFLTQSARFQTNFDINQILIKNGQTLIKNRLNLIQNVQNLVEIGQIESKPD